MSIPIMRTSERRALKRCPQMWWWAWREGLRPRGHAAPPLWFGTGVHLALALWYCGPGLKRGPHPAETWERYCGDELAFIKTIDLTEEQEARYVDAKALGIVMLEGYVNLYGKDEHKLYIQPEQTFSLDIPWTDRQRIYKVLKKKAMGRYVGTYDGVWRHADTGMIWLDEHKTAKAITLAHLPIDPQAGSYWAMAGVTLRKSGLIGPDESLSGIQYNFLRKAEPDDRPKDAEGYHCNKPAKADFVTALSGAGLVAVNGKGLEKLTLPVLQAEAEREGIVVLGERSKSQPPPLFVRHNVPRTRAERAAQLRHIQDDFVLAQAYRDGTLPLTKNSTKDCYWDCSFYHMCLLHEGGGNWEDFRDLQFRQEDPYADHRKSTDE